MSDDLIEVTILGLPVSLHRRTAAHMDDLQREFELILRSEKADADVPERLHALIAELEDRFGGVSEQPSEQIAAAGARGDERVDLVFVVPREVAEASKRLLDLLEEADRYCASTGHLLTLATPPESVAYRRWLLGEFIRQASGERARPWPPPESPVAGTDAPADDLAVPTPPLTLDLPDSWSIALDESVARLRVSGEVDLASAPTLREVAAQASAAGLRVLRLDLTEVAFVDSVGLSVLLAARQRLVENGAELIIEPSQTVRRMLDVAGVADLFGVEARS
jgi:anti-sigma B factor antagonist